MRADVRNGAKFLVRKVCETNFFTFLLVFTSFTISPFATISFVFSKPFQLQLSPNMAYSKILLFLKLVYRFQIERKRKGIYAPKYP